MVCREVRDRFSSLWEKELTSFEEKEVREHLSSCPECLREFEKFEKTMRWLHSVEEIEVPEGFLPELHKKIEERKARTTSGRPTGRWFGLPTSIKLPVQAVAMVAIVFLVLYLSKTMPTGVYQLKESRQTSSLPSSEKKPEQVLADKEAQEGRNVLHKTAEAPPPKDVDQVETAAATKGRPVASPPQMKAEVERRVLERPAETERLKKDVDREEAFAPAKGREGASQMAKKEVPSPKSEVVSHQVLDLRKQEKAEITSPEPERAGKGFAAEEKSVLALKRPQEMALTISDREKVISRLQELVKEFGGDVVTMEGNIFVASLPSVSFSEFEEKVAELGSSPKEDKLIRKKQALGSLRAAPAVKREDTPKPAVDAEGRTTVRILLIEE